MSEIQPRPGRSTLENIFMSPDQPRLRAGWRLLIHTILFILFGIMVVILAVSLGIEVASFTFGNVLNFIATTASVYVARRALDKMSFESLGLQLNRQAVVDVLVGIGITVVQMGLIFMAMLGLGWLRFEGFGWEFDPINTVIAGVLTYLIGFIIVGWNEELLSRGYHLQTIASGLNLLWGIVISSAVFGVLHLANSGASWVSTAGIFFAGVFLAYGYLRTKQLWLPIGLHIGWNFCEGVVFGFPVSGAETYKLTRIEVTGPEIWTGGVFGPEAGLIVLPALLVGAFLIYLYTANRKANV